MNVTEITGVVNELLHMHADIAKVVESLYFAHPDISDVVHYLSDGDSQYISSKEEAISIIDKVENNMEHSRRSLENIGEKILFIKTKLVNKLNEYDLD